MTPLLLPPRRRYHAQAPGARDDAPRAPAKRATLPAQRAAGNAQHVARVERLRILVVDDDFLFTDMFPRLLRKTIRSPTLEIETAKDADEATRRLQAEAFDVVLCDFDLRAARSGLHVLADAARLERPPFRILLSGHTPREVGIPEEGVMDAFLDKPMTLRELVPLLTRLLHERLGIEFETV